MYSNAGSDIFTLVFMLFIFIVIVSCFCSDDSKSSGSSKTKSTTTTKRSPNYSNNYSRSDYSECPACGAPYYNGYCEECGYPDINQGWLGENG